MRALGKDADRINALFITVDPERDTPAMMKDYLSSFDPHLRGATGDQKAIDAVEKAYRVYAKKVPTDNGDYSMDHTALVYLMDKQGRFVAPFKLDRKPEAAAADLRRYLLRSSPRGCEVRRSPVRAWHHQLNFSSAAFANLMFETISLAIMASNSCGLSGSGSTPCGASLACTVGSASAFCTSACSRSMIGRGVFAGASMPVQNV
jgi:hypothetical protein